jgi:hypothetical protein
MSCYKMLLNLRLYLRKNKNFKKSFVIQIHRCGYKTILRKTTLHICRPLVRVSFIE